MSDFTLDPRLEANSLLLGRLNLCQIRLMLDARWPWLLLIPEIENAVEWHELEADEVEAVARETAKTARVLKKVTKCTKINSGSLGNIVRQLHVHVVARREGDANWPGPVWGHGSQEVYNATDRDTLVESIKSKLFQDK